MSTIRVKPREGGMVRDPISRVIIPPEGAVVPRNNFWIRRIAFGDVSEVEETQPIVKKKKESIKENYQPKL